jgi:hypothetical protein
MLYIFDSMTLNEFGTACIDIELTGETKVFGDNLVQCHFVHYKYHMTVPGFEPRLPFQVYISTLSVVDILCYIKTSKNGLRGFSPQANYTDRATATCRRS